MIPHEGKLEFYQFENRKSQLQLKCLHDSTIYMWIQVQLYICSLEIVSDKYRISHGLCLDKIFIQRVVCFCRDRKHMSWVKNILNHKLW